MHASNKGWPATICADDVPILSAITFHRAKFVLYERPQLQIFCDTEATYSSDDLDQSDGLDETVPHNPCGEFWMRFSLWTPKAVPYLAN